MPKGERAKPVAWVCVDCQTEGLATMTGVVPFRCAPCKTRHKAGLVRAQRARNPEADAVYQRTYRLKRYGISAQEYAAMVVRADGRCEVCGDPGVLHVDHCHRERRGRGMLCPPCNKALGLLRDDPERLEALASYVRER